MVNTLSFAAIFKIHILFQEYLCIKKILVNTYDAKFEYNAYSGFGILSRHSVRNKFLLGTTTVLKVRVTVLFTKKTGHHCCAQGSFHHSLKCVTQTY